ncbi:glutamate receptor -like isoform X1 [Olea europaea subsp. europaea]|uniref:Glutamate receptor -like isoform X1 n=2 Tax=Olea europaea subsp. europaea TaxID=158383 RepID=A0A8S0QVZ5_OLEEU|nr:glutamate receptor -like isoform X1 [Olea europaea subsp. europaea]
MEKRTLHRKMSPLLYFLLIFSAGFMQAEAKENKKRCNCPGDCPHIFGRIGSVIDQSSRVGKEQKIAIQMAVDDYTQWLNCSKLDLHIKDSNGKFARAASTAIDLVKKENAQAIIAALTLEEATFLSEFEEVSTTPIITIGSAAISPSQLFLQPSSVSQMNNDISIRMQCAAAIIGYFRWRRVTVIYEQSNSFYSDSRLKTQLSESLKAFNSFVEFDLAFPSLTSLREPEAFIQEELKKLKTKRNGIFLLMQSSLEFSTILFEKAKKMGLMEKGYAWILFEDVVSLLDSLEPSSIRNMQGVIGFKTNFVDKSKNFQDFKFRFRKTFQSSYPEEEYPNPSMYALQAYDATAVIAKFLQNSKGKMNSSAFIKYISSSNFEGLIGKISFKNQKTSQNTTFQIINVIGKSYRQVALWSPEHGFSRDFIDHKRKGTRRKGKKCKELASIYWPGGEQTVPQESELKIGVPAMAAFHQFVHVSHDQVTNQTFFSGFSLEVFEAAIKLLLYRLPHVFVPFNGTYDELVIAVYNKTLDAAVGDMNILENRYRYADFSLPYLDNQVVMVVPAHKDLKRQGFIVVEAFEWKLWAVLAALSQCTAAIIYFNEKVNGNTEFADSFPEMIGSILWLSITVLSFAHRESIRNNLSRLTLAIWLCVIVVVTASYTAVLSSMMTVPRLKPSIVDIDYLKNSNATVGCNGKGFVVKYLLETLKFNRANIKKIASISDYPEAFEKGQISAAFLISPHAKVFVAKNKRYVVAKPSFEVGGLAFVFPKGSSLTDDISQAILNMKENGAINQMEERILSLPTRTSSREPDDKLSLGLEHFSGPLMVTSAIDAIVLCVIIIRVIDKGWSSDGYIHSWLMHRRIWWWVSFLFAKSHVRFGSRFFRPPIVMRQNNQIHIVQQ